MNNYSPNTFGFDYDTCDDGCEKLESQWYNHRRIGPTQLITLKISEMIGLSVKLPNYSHYFAQILLIQKL